MIEDGTAPGRVFKISELARLIASQLNLTNKRSVVNLACVCRYLEEPVLSILWETQSSLPRLLKVLPGETWECDILENFESMVCGPNPPLDA